MFEPSISEPAGWLYALCVGGAAILVGIAKAGFGGGIGILAVPLMALVLPPQDMLGVMLPVLMFGDVMSLPHHWGGHSQRHFAWLIVGAAMGIAVGTLLLWWLRQTHAMAQVLNLVIGGVCLAMVAVQCYRLVGGRLPRIPPHPLAGRVTGLVAGVASTLTHAAGPVISIYLLEQRLEKRKLVGTAVLFAFVGNLLKLPTYLGLGLISRHTMGQSLWCLPLVMLGTFSGAWLHHRVPERPFAAVIYLGAAASAAHMVVKSLF
ncbi:MAG TPA: sulfite exporter TauE/SafE family protein [Phycisphaeraceae bacterium]